MKKILTLLPAVIICALCVCMAVGAAECEHNNATLVSESEATCTEDATKIIFCSDCNKKITVTTKDKLGHKAGSWKTLEEADCTKEGLKVKYCSRCDQIVSEEVIEKKDHSYPTKWDTVEEATCTKEGLKQRECKKCGYIDKETIEKKSHTYGNTETVKATCYATGTKTKVCKNCGHVDQEILEKTSHSYNKWEVIEEATCSKQGVKTRTCKNCPETETETIEKESHKYGKWETITKSTCEAQGQKMRVCSVCNHTEFDDIDYADHDVDSWTTVTKATCTTKGKKRGYCDVCNQTVYDEIQKTGHEYGEWKTSTKATCTTDGKKYRTCSNCGTTDYETIDKKGHDYGEWKITKEATETSTGTRQRTCSTCSAKDTETISKLTHAEKTYKKTSKAVTCTENGEEQELCEYCNKVIKSTVVEAKGHSFTPWTITQNASRDTIGKKEQTCSTCGYVNSQTFDYELPGRKGFKTKRTYDSRFQDIKDTNWYYKYVTQAYEYELVNGTTDTKFSPNDSFTVAQALTIATNIHSAYYGDTVDEQRANEKWYVRYVRYCTENGIITRTQFNDYNRNITRGEMAMVFANILPAEEYAAVRDGIPSDIDSSMTCYNAVEKLFKAGIVSGDKGTATYRPNDQLKRSEASAIFAGIVIEDYRSK